MGIKVPATDVGFGVAATLAAQGTSVLVTAVYEAPQALYAASIGARYIAPYLGRLDDAGRDGAAEIGVMAELVAGSGTEVLAASLRSPARIVDLARRGVTVCTAKPEVLRAAMVADASDAAAAAFEEAMTAVA
ncbi:transaldolase family protein [Salana multivorans]